MSARAPQRTHRAWRSQEVWACSPTAAARRRHAHPAASFSPPTRAGVWLKEPTESPKHGLGYWGAACVAVADDRCGCPGQRLVLAVLVWPYMRGNSGCVKKAKRTIRILCYRDTDVLVDFDWAAVG